MEWLPQKSSHIEKIVSAHSSYLLKRYGVLHQKQFVQRYTSDEQAGVAEAVVFTWFSSISHDPGVLEDPS